VIDFEDIEELTDLVGLPYWVLSGSDLHCEDSTPDSDYPLDLDAVPEGSKVGLKVTLDGNLHFFVNGVDMGVAAADLPIEGEDIF
jgi:neuralized-like protein 4